MLVFGLAGSAIWLAGAPGNLSSAVAPTNVPRTRRTHKGETPKTPTDPRPTAPHQSANGIGYTDGTQYHVRIPHPNRVLDTEFPHEHAVHPPEAELYELNALIG